MMAMTNMSTHRKFAAAAIALVVLAVGLGLWLAGSPGKERARKYDQTRVSDLQMISSAIDAYHAKNARLPGSLSELVGEAKGEWYVRTIVDPETAAIYEYQATGDKTYKLCAVFTMPSDPQMNDPMRPMAMPSYPSPVYPDWNHPAGSYCFDLTVNEMYGRPYGACGLTNPCAAGQTCASLGSKGTFCVPAGLECQAAGCPGSCAIMESYPVQVRCDDPTPDETETPPEHPVDGSQCQLFKHQGSGKFECFGCSSQICKDPAAGWEPYTAPEGSVGIPYSCYDAGGTEGCQLAQ